MKRDDLLVLYASVAVAAMIIAGITTLMAINAQRHAYPVMYIYANYTWEAPHPRHTNITVPILIPIKVRLKVWLNGKLVVDKEDPATLNLAHVVNQMLGSSSEKYTATNGITYTTNLGATNGYIGCNGNYNIIVANGTVPWSSDANVYHMNGTILTDSVHIVTRLGNTVEIVGGFLFATNFTVRSVGLECKLNAISTSSPILLAADNVTELDVHPGDNLTIAYFITFPNVNMSKLFASFLVSQIAVQAPNPTPGPYVVVGSNSTVPLTCYHDAFGYNGIPMTMGICIGVATNTSGTVQRFVYSYTASYAVGYTPRYVQYTLIDVNFTNGPIVTNNTPIAVAFVIKWS